MADAREVGTHRGLVERALDVLAALHAAADGDRTAAERAAGMVATNLFESVDRAKQVRRWTELLEHLRARDRTDARGCTVRRADAAGNLVFLEMKEEDGTAGGTTTTMMVLQFQPDGRLCRMDRFG